MTVYITLDMPKIEKARKGGDKKEKHDPMPDTLAALRDAGFKAKRHQGSFYRDHFVLRGTIEDENAIKKIRKIPFIYRARKVN